MSSDDTEPGRVDDDLPGAQPRPEEGIGEIDRDLATEVDPEARGDVDAPGAASLDDVSALREVEIPASELPPIAGARADRRLRQGPSLGRGLWLASIFLLLCSLAALALYVAFPPPPLPAVLGAPAPLSRAVDPAQAGAQSLADASRASLRRLARHLATRLASPPVLVLAADAPPEAALAADSREELLARIDALGTKDPDLQLAVVDKKGAIVHAAGSLEADAPALSSAVQALLGDQDLPAARVGALSSARPDGLRVAVLLAAPALDPAPFTRLQRRLDASQAQSGKLLRELDRSRQDLRILTQHWLWLCALALLAPLLALGVLRRSTWRPLDRGLRVLLQRTTARVAGQDLDETPLPQELAGIDAIVARALSMHQSHEAQSAERGDLQQSLSELVGVCQRAAGGDLSARVQQRSVETNDIAHALDHLIESFEKRALRLRSHARDQDPQSDQIAVSTVEQLKKRSQALAPLAKLLADIGARLRHYQQALIGGQDVSADLLRLAEAVSARSRTASSYLSTLDQAIDQIGEAPRGPVAERIEQELASLTLDESFASQVGALRDLGSEEIGRRWQRDGDQASTDADDSAPAAEPSSHDNPPAE